MLLRRTVPVIFLLLLTTFCYASGDDEHRQHGSHVHGIGHLNIAVDGNDVYIELENPSANIVGFEHVPSTDEQRHSVHEAAEKLENGDHLFIFSKQAHCTQVSSTVSSPLLAHNHQDEHHNPKGDHDPAEGHGHHNESDHSTHKDDAHSEFTAEYRFTCKQPEKLKAMETKIFSIFPGVEKIKTQVLTNTRQTGAELTAKDYRIEL